MQRFHEDGTCEPMPRGGSTSPLKEYAHQILARIPRGSADAGGLLDAARLVFIDETVVTSNMVHPSGWSPRGGEVPMQHWETPTFTAGFCKRSPLLIKGAMNGETRLAYRTMSRPGSPAGRRRRPQCLLPGRGGGNWGPRSKNCNTCRNTRETSTQSNRCSIPSGRGYANRRRAQSTGWSDAFVVGQNESNVQRAFSLVGYEGPASRSARTT
jgi:hypothetical protein